MIIKIVPTLPCIISTFFLACDKIPTHLHDLGSSDFPFLHVNFAGHVHSHASTSHSKGAGHATSVRNGHMHLQPCGSYTCPAVQSSALICAMNDTSEHRWLNFVRADCSYLTVTFARLVMF